MLAAQGSAWRMLTPQRDAFNENYFTWRTGRGFDLEQLDDLVLSSPGGNRHLSRAQVRAGEVDVVRLANTHLVTDKDAEARKKDGRACRIEQARQIGVDAAGTALPYILAGDLNDTVPLPMGRLDYVPGDSRWSTHTKWGAARATQGQRIDHHATDGVQVLEVETRGIRPDGTWTTNPRPGDHQAVVVTYRITF